MTRWLITSAVYAALFLMSPKFNFGEALMAGLLCGGASILALKLFGMDKKE